MRYVQNTLAAMLMLLCLVNARTAVGQEKVLYNFGFGADGAGPDAGLLMDSKGHLFGTTVYGGSGTYHVVPTDGAGTAYELSPVAGGGWSERVIHEFGSYPTDGANPQGALIADGKGNLFGTTTGGGANSVGTVFELSPAVDGTYSEKVIYSFGSYAADGAYSYGNLVLDGHGNLYGTTETGGGSPICTGSYGGCGTVFELIPGAHGAWTEKVIYSFGTSRTDGDFPVDGLAIDAVGDLYGTTFLGGTLEGGTVFKLMRSGGEWTEKILHNFQYGSGAFLPAANVILDREGNLYGTTQDGGTASGGTVFELSPSPGGAYTDRFFDLGAVLSENGSIANLAIDPLGNLYGTTLNTVSNSDGSVFELTPQPGGSWTYTDLQDFSAYSGDGEYSPRGGLIFDKHGNLYGVTGAGGNPYGLGYGYGTVFEIGAVVSGVPTRTVVSAPFPTQTSSPLVAGQPITLEVTVAPTGGLAIPTGTVTFADPAGGSVTVPVIAGKATYYGIVPPVGTYSIYASYSGGSGFLPSQSATLTQSVTMP